MGIEARKNRRKIELKGILGIDMASGSDMTVIAEPKNERRAEMERLVIKDADGNPYYYDAERGLKLESYEVQPLQRREVLERLYEYEDAGLTPDQIRELAERDTAKAPEEIQDAYGDTRLICPNCRNSVINYFNRSRPPQFCMICGQHLKWEE